jgi:hypothetical protein
MIAGSAFAGRPDAPPPELARLRILANDLTGVVERRDRTTGTWSPSEPVDVAGREILRGRYIENGLRMQFTGEPRPSEVRMLWSYDVFQKRYRLVIMDDLVGTMDVFEQSSEEPLAFTNAYGNRLTVHPLGETKVRMEVEATKDGGKTWTEVMRVTLTAK